MSSNSLLDDEGALSVQFEIILQRIFLTFASSSTPTTSTSEEVPNKGSSLVRLDPHYDVFSNERTLARSDLDAFSVRTNGAPMTDETFAEITEYFDLYEEEEQGKDKVAGQARLTFKGFLQLYQLQTENEEDETWRDLEKWGYDKNLHPIDLDEGTTLSAPGPASPSHTDEPNSITEKGKERALLE